MCLPHPALYTMMILVLHMWLFNSFEHTRQPQNVWTKCLWSKLCICKFAAVCIPKVTTWRGWSRGLTPGLQVQHIVWLSFLCLSPVGPQETEFGAEGLASADPLIWLVSCLLCFSSGSLIKMIVSLSFAGPARQTRGIICWEVSPPGGPMSVNAQSTG